MHFHHRRTSSWTITALGKKLNNHSNYPPRNQSQQQTEFRSTYYRIKFVVKRSSTTSDTSRQTYFMSVGSTFPSLMNACRTTRQRTQPSGERCTQEGCCWCCCCCCFRTSCCISASLEIRRARYEQRTRVESTERESKGRTGGDGVVRWIRERPKTSPAAVTAASTEHARLSTDKWFRVLEIWKVEWLRIREGWVMHKYIELR